MHLAHSSFLGRQSKRHARPLHIHIYRAIIPRGGYARMVVKRP